MRIYADGQQAAERLLVEEGLPWRPVRGFPSDGIETLAGRLFGKRPVVLAEHPDTQWSDLFVVESAPASQYDILIDLARHGVPLPDRLICSAGSGHHFHGSNDRPWSASPGNLHLSVRFSPPSIRGDVTIGLLALAAVSVVEAVDAIPGLERRAGIKWVNDILIDGAKVCGILAHTEAIRDRVTTGVIGIGLNVETTPDVENTPFVPHVASLKDLLSHPVENLQGRVFRHLATGLSRNYRGLIGGDYYDLLDRYRERSNVIGREVAVCRENAGSASDAFAKGRVRGLGQHLELLLDGYDKPINKGRLILYPTGDRRAGIPD